MEVLGVPPDNFIQKGNRSKLFFDAKSEGVKGGVKPKIKEDSRGRSRLPATKELSVAVKSQDKLFLDFIAKCLNWIPSERMTPEEALEHDWVKEMLPVTPKNKP